MENGLGKPPNESLNGCTSEILGVKSTKPLDIKINQLFKAVCSQNGVRKRLVLIDSPLLRLSGEYENTSHAFKILTYSLSLLNTKFTIVKRPLIQNEDNSDEYLFMIGHELITKGVYPNELVAEEKLLEEAFELLKKNCFYLIQKKVSVEKAENNKNKMDDYLNKNENNKELKRIRQRLKKEISKTEPQNLHGSKAHLIMLKMGWTDGKGLGSKEQGIINPVEIKYVYNGTGFGMFNGEAKKSERLLDMEELVIVFCEFAKSSRNTILRFAHGYSESAKRIIFSLATIFELHPTTRKRLEFFKKKMKDPFHIVSNLLKCGLENDKYKVEVPSNFQYLLHSEKDFFKISMEEPPNESLNGFTSEVLAIKPTSTKPLDIKIIQLFKAVCSQNGIRNRLLLIDSPKLSLLLLREELKKTSCAFKILTYSLSLLNTKFTVVKGPIIQNEDNSSEYLFMIGDELITKGVYANEVIAEKILLEEAFELLKKNCFYLIEKTVSVEKAENNKNRIKVYLRKNEKNKVLMQILENIKTEPQNLQGSKAYKMMLKMGWTDGKGLGSKEQGIIDPVECVSNQNRFKMSNGKDKESTRLLQMEELVIVLYEFAKSSRNTILRFEQGYSESAKRIILSVAKIFELQPTTRKRLEYFKKTTNYPHIVFNLLKCGLENDEYKLEVPSNFQYLLNSEKESFKFSLEGPPNKLLNGFTSEILAVKPTPTQPSKQTCEGWKLE